MQPGPRRTGFHDGIQRAIRRKQREQSFRPIDADSRGSSTRSPILLMITTTTTLCEHRFLRRTRWPPCWRISGILVDSSVCPPTLEANAL